MKFLTDMTLTGFSRTNGAHVATSEHIHPAHHEKDLPDTHLENVDTITNVTYDNLEEEPELHLRTWIALAAVMVLNFTQIIALQSPPAVLSYISADLDGVATQTWVPNALSLTQAVMSPIIASASDIFQARKILIIAGITVAFIGSAIAPGSENIYRLIAAQAMIGGGLAVNALGVSIGSEIMPRRWRPLSQAAINTCASLGACVGPLIIGALTKQSLEHGWRKFYWIEMALWGLSALGFLFGYRPPKRHTDLDHLSFLQKLGSLDLLGSALLATGLTLFLTGLGLGGNPWAWSNARVLVTLILGIVILLLFALYEWKGTKTGILHHDLFRGGKEAGRSFAIYVCLMLVEGLLLFSYVIFYPVLTVTLFETDPFLVVARAQPFWLASGLTTMVWGYLSARFRSIRYILMASFLILTAGIIGLATIQPSDSTNAIIFSGLAGIGFAGPLVLLITGVQLCTPHHLIATATATLISSRAIAATTFTAIYAAAVGNKLAKNIPGYIVKSALGDGLPPASLPALIAAITHGKAEAAAQVPGVTPAIIGAAFRALKQAYADSIRVCFIIAVPFGILACIGCLFLGKVRVTMTYRVDAPVEDLRAKHAGEGDVMNA